MDDTWYQRLCGFLTTHRWRRIFGGSIGDEWTEHYYVCRICGKHITERRLRNNVK